LSDQTDALKNGRRLRRRLFFWRALAILAVLGLIVVWIDPEFPADHVARLTVDGEISDTAAMVKAVDKLAKDDTAKALVVAISSPGGGVYASVALHDAIARVAAVKPVVAVMGATAASGGFMIAMPAQRVFANAATVTGSIGVLLQSPEISGLLDKLGVSAETLVSGPLKDQPSLTHRLSDRGRTVMQGIVDDLYAQFVAIVAAGRHMDPARVRELADGRAYTGRQALALGLIDELGDEAAARRWLASTKAVSADLAVRDLKVAGRARRLWAKTLGPALAEIMKTVLYQGLELDGPQLLWQPLRSQ
jgi:protease-4